MRESSIEKYLTKKVKEKGGLCWKFVSPNLRGVPDRLVMTPEGRTIFVELKAPGKTAEEHQKRRHAELESRFHPVRVIDTKEKVDEFIKAWL